MVGYALAALGGYIVWKNRSKIFHGHAPGFKGPAMSAATQQWYAAQTPEDQAVYNQMMAARGSFAVGAGVYDCRTGCYVPLGR